MTRQYLYRCPKCGTERRVLGAGAVVTCNGHVNHLGVYQTHRHAVAELVQEEERSR